MTSFKTPGRNCPACCPQKCGSIHHPTRLNPANGPIQVPIYFGKEKPQSQLPINLSGPRRFSGKDWRDRFEGLNYGRTKNFKGILNEKENQTHSWSGGPGNSVKADMALEFGSVGEITQSGIALLKRQYGISCAEVAAAVKYLRHLWITTNGSYSQKVLVVNRMICFYLILLGIYVAETSFWVNQQLFEGFCGIILKPKRNMDMLMGIGAVVVFIFFLYLIGGPSNPRGVCNTPA